LGSGSTIWPEVRVSIRHAADASVRPSIPVHFGEFPAGCDIADVVCANQKVGEAPKPVGSIDTSGMAVDPFDDEAIWMVHGYGYPNGKTDTAASGTWRLVVAKIFGRPHPDLMVRSVAVSERTLAIGSLFQARVTVRNQGDGPSDEAAVEVVLASTDPSQAPVRLVEGRARSIPSGRQRRVLLETSIPVGLAPGEYLLFARVDHDGKVREYSESNNTSEGVLLQITKPVAP
jgi:hypothetical protein